MGLLDKIAESTFGLQGITPPKFGDTAGQSTLHNAYSINGDPAMVGKPTPSNLDLNGQTPDKYTDNLPG